MSEAGSSLSRMPQLHSVGNTLPNVKCQNNIETSKQISVCMAYVRPKYVNVTIMSIRNIVDISHCRCKFSSDKKGIPIVLFNIHWDRSQQKVPAESPIVYCSGSHPATTTSGHFSIFLNISSKREHQNCVDYYYARSICRRCAQLCLSRCATQQLEFPHKWKIIPSTRRPMRRP